MIFNSQLKTIYKEAARVLGETATRHDVDKSAPQDLKDTAPLWNYTRDGSPVSSLLLPQDFERGVDSPMSGITNVVVAVAILVLSGIISGIVAMSGNDAMHGFIVSVAALSLVCAMLFGVTGFKAGVIAAAMAPPFALLGFLYSIFYNTRTHGDRELFGPSRDEAIYDQTQKDGSSMSYLQDWLNIVRIKTKQAISAAADRSQFITLGLSMGHLRLHGDPFAPDGGGDFGYSVADMSTHTVVLGKTGTGKTVLIRKVVKQIFEKTKSGALVLCGKGTLPGELVGLDHEYVLLNPENSKLALFQGMSAMEVTDALAVRGERDDAFFYSSARALLKNCAVLLKALADQQIEGYRFTPKNLLRMINSNGGKTETGYDKHGAYRAAALKVAENLDGSLLATARDYFDAEFQSIQKAEKTLAGVMMHANMWLEPLFTNESIAKWAECDEGEDITLCCAGKRIGIDVPATTYGQAASAIITNLVRQRLYSALKKRGNGWRKVEEQTEVLLLIDEMHLVWQASSGDGMDDNSMVSIARSLGGMYLVGTQSIDEMESRFGEEKTLASLGNFRNLVCYEATMKTLEYASSMVGAILRPVYTINQEDGEVAGMMMLQALNMEQLAPKNFGGRLGSDAASLAKRMVRNTPLKYLVSARSHGGAPEADRAVSAVGNNAKATYMAATSDELQIMLQERFCAVAVLNRAGAPRRDVILVDPQAAV